MFLVSSSASAATAGEVGDAEAASLRHAIEDLARTFGQRYPRGDEFLARLEGVDARGLAELRREALLANPLVSGQPMVFVVRSRDTYGTHEYMGPRTFRQPGAALKRLDPKTGQVTTLVETATGAIRSPCVNFDGKRIVFAMSRNDKDNFHIYEITVDPSAQAGRAAPAVRQLTSASDVSDVDPIYLPDGQIAFASTREIKYVPCDTQLVPQLFSMDGDGANIRQITRSTAHENQLSLMPDGRILYSRWDYVDRNFGDGHGFWAANPDGTNQAIIWGNNSAHPSAGWNARAMPDSGRLLCILGTHHGTLGGALAILDPQDGIDGRDSIIRTWPAHVKTRYDSPEKFDEKNEKNIAVRKAVGTWSPEVRRMLAEDANLRLHRWNDDLNDVKPWYNTPWPLSDKYFLCVRAKVREGPPSIFLVDTFGNEIMLHGDPVGCYSPMPLAPTAEPTPIPSRRDYGNGNGLFIIQSVYKGTHVKGVKPGSVKSLRVVEALSKRGLSGSGWNGLGQQSPGMNWTDFNAKRILGTVPVEQDGSAYFAVPPDRFLYFQLLDENGMMIQSMRSGTAVHSGETLGCVGCHESRLAADESPRGQPVPLAIRRAPSELRQWYGPARAFSYMREVQPVLDKYCVKCHDFGKKGAAKVILAGDRTPSFNVSYMELWSKGYTGAIGAGPAAHLPAYSWGSHASKLITHLMKGHNDIKLDAESLDRLITWVDLNGPYYPTTCCAYPDNPPGRSPIARGEMLELCRLTGIKSGELWRTTDFQRPMVSLDRPELSPCLAAVKDSPAKYDRVLAIIRAGQKQLQTKPRADMPGFSPLPRDLQRQAHLDKYQDIETRVREAIRQGRKLKDSDADPVNAPGR